MRPTKALTALLSLGALTLAVAALGSPRLEAAEVIVNAAQAAQPVSRSYLRGMFGMRVRAWPDGTPVRVFVLPDDSPVHDSFTRTFLLMYPYQLRQNWDRLVYSGTGQPPILVASEEEMLRQVAATPGAIGYTGRLKESAPSNVKVLHVQ